MINLVPRFENRGTGVDFYVPANLPAPDIYKGNSYQVPLLSRMSTIGRIPDDFLCNFCKKVVPVSLLSTVSIVSFCQGISQDITEYGDHSKAVTWYIIGSVGSVLSAALIFKDCIYPVWCKDKKKPNLDSVV